MRILVAWDDANEAELLNLYLTAGGNEVVPVANPEELLAVTNPGAWDVVLLALTFTPNSSEAFALFERLRHVLPDTPIVLACRIAEMLQLPRFLVHGLRFYLIRDQEGQFIFLVLSCLESAVAATRAEESRKLAERLREEMDAVRRLQEAIVPQGLRPPAGYRVAARYEPAQLTTSDGRPVVMAGGDYYDLFLPDDRNLVLLVGDASGHGLKACMSIMVMHTLIRMVGGDRYLNTAAFVGDINQRLCENSIVQSGGGFITLLYACIDTTTHTMSWTSAGHPNALVHRLDDNEIEQVGLSTDGGLPLGIAPGLTYDSFSYRLPRRSRLLLYSDGLTDAICGKGEEHAIFGLQGIRDTLRAGRDRSLDEVLDQLFAASHSYTGGDGRHDDTSVLLLERLD
jgi:serine phosphatase RsbU (regulator of sigma subunit)